MGIQTNLKANGYKNKIDLQRSTHKLVWNHVEMFRYSVFFKKGIGNSYLALQGLALPDDSIGDTHPWYEKKGLEKILQQREYQQEFSSQTFDMSRNNLQIYFLDKIIAHQRNSHTLIFLAGTNEKLMHQKVITPGYSHNLQLIDHYFNSQPIQYLNMQGKINSNLFCDHVHLTSSGYKELSQLLWNHYETGDKS